MVSLHGATLTSETWEETGTIQSLASAGYRVIAVDIPGLRQLDKNRGSSNRRRLVLSAVLLGS